MQREPWDHQTRGLESLRASLRSGKRRPMLSSPTGCHAPGTPIMMLDGSTKLVEDVVVGDVLMGPDSTGRTVRALHRGHDEMVEIRPIKGDAFTVNAGHILTLVRTNDGTHHSGVWIDIAVNDYLAESPTFRHSHKLVRVGVDFPSRVQPSLDPYFAGVLIGDGGLTRAANITTPDAEIVEAIYEHSASLGVNVRVDQTPDSEANTYHLVTPRGAPNPLLLRLAHLGLRGKGAADKFLPDAYRLGSRKTRMSVLAGLLDTDGWLGCCCFEFSSRSRKLADDVVFVARSLGFRACISEKIVNGESYWRVNISGHTDTIPTRIVRKQAPPRRQSKDPLRTGFTVHPVGPGEFFGFEVDGDHRYVMGDFTVTHNSGKTGLSAMIIANARAKGKTVLFCVPFLTLIDQTVRTFVDDFGLLPEEIGVIQASHPETDVTRPIQVASIQTLMRRKVPLVDLVLLDEAHVLYEFVVRWMRDPAWAHVPFIGLSATPWRRGLGKHFDDLIQVTTTDELITKGLLSDYRVFAPSHVNLDGVGVAAGDFVAGQLSAVMSEPTLVADVVENWLRRGGNLPTLVFATDRAHASILQQKFQSAGVPTGYIDCNIDGEDRKPILEQFRRGEIKVICNVATMTTGVDLDVRCIVLARPTQSEALFCQMVGRGLRLAPGKTECLIFDHSDTHQRLGFVRDISHSMLSNGGEKPKARPKERSKLKECGNSECRFLMPSNYAACPACDFKPERQCTVETLDGDLQEIGALQRFEFASSRAEQQRWFSALITIGRQRSYKANWAAVNYYDKFSEWPGHLDQRPGTVDRDVSNWLKFKAIRFSKGRTSTNRRAS